MNKMQLSLKNIFKKTLIKDLAKVVVFDFFARFILCLVSIVLIRMLSPKEYSVFTKLFSLAYLFNGIFGAGTGVAFVRKIAEDDSSNTHSQDVSLHFCGIVTIFFFFLVSLILSPYIARAYKLSIFLTGFALLYGFVLCILDLNKYFYQGKEQYVKSGILNVSSLLFIVLPIFICFFFQIHPTINGLISMYIFAGAIACSITSFIIYKSSRFTCKNISVPRYKSMLSESSWLIVYYSILAVMNQCNIILMSRYSDELQIACYGVALKYYSLLLMVLPVIHTVLRVKTSHKEYTQDAGKCRTFVFSWLKTTGPAGIVLIPFFIFGAHLVLPYLNGVKYNAAIPVLDIFIVGAMISLVFAPNVPILMAMHRHGLMCLYVFIGLAVNVIGFLLTSGMGALSAAFWTVAANAVLNISSTLTIIWHSRNVIAQEEKTV